MPVLVFICGDQALLFLVVVFLLPGLHRRRALLSHRRHRRRFFLAGLLSPGALRDPLPLAGWPGAPVGRTAAPAHRARRALTALGKLPRRIVLIQFSRLPEVSHSILAFQFVECED